MNALGSENPPPTFFSIFLMASGPLLVTLPPEILRSQASQAQRWMSATENWSPIHIKDQWTYSRGLYIREHRV